MKKSANLIFPHRILATIKDNTKETSVPIHIINAFPIESHNCAPCSEKIFSKLANPINTGSLNKSYSVKEIYSEKNSGANKNKSKPIDNGAIQKYPHKASVTLRLLYFFLLVFPKVKSNLAITTHHP